MTPTEAVRALAKQRTGFSSRDVMNRAACSMRSAANAIDNLRLRGEVHSVRLSAKRSIHFGRKAWADSFRDELNERNRHAHLYSLRKLRAVEARPEGDTILPEDVVVQVCPSFEPRHQSTEVAAAPRVYYGGLGRVR